MKRSPNIIFGGFYAFSGGKVEDQDLYETWQDSYPEIFTTLKRKFYDFDARVCAIRETFEEINTLIAKPLNANDVNEPLSNLREEYLKVYKSDFIAFCKAKKIVPDLEVIYGYRRVSSGFQIMPGIDN